jgi:nicotinamide mononucleotide transporter
MSAVAAALVEELRNTSVVEWLAVASALLYLLFAIRQSIWCWAFALVSTALYTLIFLEARLYMESVLNVYYFAVAIYGWVAWTRGTSQSAELPVSTRPIGFHAIAVAVLLLLTAANGYLLESRTDAEFPYVDSFTTWGAMWTTLLVARKILENWWYWFVIDGISVVVYWLRDLELTAALFVIYLVMIPFGLVSWRRSMRGAGA